MSRGARVVDLRRNKELPVSTSLDDLVKALLRKFAKVKTKSQMVIEIEGAGKEGNLGNYGGGYLRLNFEPGIDKVFVEMWLHKWWDYLHVCNRFATAGDVILYLTDARR